MTGRDITPEDLAPGTPRTTRSKSARLTAREIRDRLDSQCGRIAALETNRTAHYNRAANAERRLAALERRGPPWSLWAAFDISLLLLAFGCLLFACTARGAEVWMPNGAGAEFCALAAPFDITGLEACVATDSGPEACFPMGAGGAPPCVIPPEFGIWAAVVVPVSTEETRQLLVANPIGVRARWHARDGSYTEWAPRLVLTGEDSPGILYVTLRRQAEATP